VMGGDLANGVHLASHAPVVHRHDCPRVGRDEFLDLSFI